MDKLADYRGKRDASRTPEPVPPAAVPPEAVPQADARPAAGQPPATGGIFVVQEHHARRLHWDFRLERDGVLVSWALPSDEYDAVGGIHHAVPSGDHTLEYAEFHGEIPHDEYDGGAVTIWYH